MIRTTYNYTYNCDRCGTEETYKKAPFRNWRPRGWTKVSGIGKSGREICGLTFCPDCSSDLFSQDGIAVTKPKKDCETVEVYTWCDKEPSYTVEYKVVDDDDFSIGLTD